MLLMFAFVNGVDIVDVFVPEICVGLCIFQFGWELLHLTDTVFANAP
jgi:hypothetical protein